MKGEDNMYSIETSLGFTMGKLSQKMSEIFEKSLNAKGITPKQYAILVEFMSMKN